MALSHFEKELEELGGWKMGSEWFLGDVPQRKFKENEELVPGNARGCWDHQGLHVLPAHHPMKEGRINGKELSGQWWQRCGAPQAQHAPRSSEAVRMPNFSKKAIKGRLLASHEMDILPQGPCERVSWLRRGLATKSRKKNKRQVCQSEALSQAPNQNTYD